MIWYGNRDHECNRNREYCPASDSPFQHPLQTLPERLSEEIETDDQPDPEAMFLWACGFSLALGVVGVLLGTLFGPDALELLPTFERDHLVTILWQTLLGCAAALPMMASIEVLRKLPWESVKELERLSEDETISTLLSLSPIKLLLISICAGLGEEVLFRGWILPRLSDQIAMFGFPNLSLTLAILISSILFGALHPITKLYFVLAAIMGAYFAALMLLTNSLLVPIAAHAAYDAMQLLVSSYRLRNET